MAKTLLSPTIAITVQFTDVGKLLLPSEVSSDCKLVFQPEPKATRISYEPIRCAFDQTPRTLMISASVTFSLSLTCAPPKPRMPPSLPASATTWAI